MDWPHFTLQPDGTLKSDDGDFLVGLDGKTATTFASAQDAEQYLVDFDIRGSVREIVCSCTTVGRQRQGCDVLEHMHCCAMKGAR